MKSPGTESRGDRLRLSMHCRPPPGADTGPRTGEPLTCGVPFPRGVLGSVADLGLEDASRERVGLQARVLDHWSDGSVRWALLDWLATTTGKGDTYLLHADGPTAAGEDSDSSDSGALVVDVLEDGASAVVSTGAARFRLRAGGGFPFDRVTVESEPALDVARSGLVAEDGSGALYEARVDRVRVTETGPVRAAVELTGHLAAEGEHPLADLRAMLHFGRGQSVARIELTITNPRRARHPGNIWQLGDAGSILLRDLALTLAVPAGGRSRVRCSPEVGQPYRDADDALELYQDSSGGENWRSRNHVDRNGRVPLAFRGYRWRCGDERREGLRASPVIELQAGARSLALAPRYFWQDFPSALEASGTAVTLRLFPRQSTGPHELQGGERKTHLLAVAFGSDGITDEPLAWYRSPLLAHADPAWYAAAQAVPGLMPRSEDSDAGYQELVDQAIEGETSFEHRREVVDEYGWRHFGDLWADHEAVRHDGPEPLISHYNNQYDALHGCAVQFLRGVDRRWFELMAAMARHATDIDLYHTDDDKSAYSHGQFWHTVHYTDAGTSTHRSYPAPESPSDSGTTGGGPSGGHLYTSGLMTHYFMTGCERSREAVVGLGRYVIAADDGARSIFRFVDRSRTGHVTLSAPGYHGPGRSAANSLNALLDADRLTGDSRFLDKAEEIVARVIHPADDLEALDLLDAERRWFYTMFLQTLGKYLEYKAEKGQVDTRYAYARAALLHYARWAVEHEAPYLSRRESLEFPTETWPAQDMRKSEVFQLAARHVAGEERGRLQERAAYFFRYAIDTLRSMPTRGLCRPVVLMLTCGYRQGYFERHADEEMPRPAGEGVDFGRPRHFVGQRQRVERKLAAGAIAVLVLVVGLLAAWVVR